MYILYVDESGSPELSSNTNHFVLVGVAIPIKFWANQSTQISNLKLRHDLEGVEIHAAWMARRYIEQEKITDFGALSHQDRKNAVMQERKITLRTVAATGKRKKLNNLAKTYRKTEPYIHLTFDERRQALKAFGQMVNGWGTCRLFGEAIAKAHFNRSHSIFEQAFTQVVSRFEKMLVNFSSSQAEDVQGIIVQDNDETEARKLTDLMKDFHYRGTPWRRIDKIVETPLFVDSQLTEMIQIADVCAYATRRFFENGETWLFDLIYPKFDRVNQVVVGLRHYTGSVGCGCKVCRDHQPI